MLQTFAHHALEESNQALIEDAGWPIDHFVPPPVAPSPADGPDLGDLDRLWQPKATSTEQAYLHAALHDLVLQT